MKKTKTWYVLVKNNENWVVWKNSYIDYGLHGSYGSIGIFAATKKKDCLDYCKENKIRLSKDKAML